MTTTTMMMMIYSQLELYKSFGKLQRIILEILLRWRDEMPPRE